MKKITLMALVAFAMVAATSCDKDNDDLTTPEGNDTTAVADTTAPAPQITTGTFTGWTEANAAYFSGMVNDETDTLAIALNDDGTLSMTYSSDTWGRGVFASVAITSTDNGFSAEGVGTLAMAGRGGEVKEYEATVSGLMSADFATYSFTINVPSVMGGTVLTLHEGEVPLSKVVAGSYAGWSHAAFAYAPDGMDNDGDTITISANADGTLNIAYTSATWGNGTFKGCTVQRTEGGYAIAEHDGTVAMSMRGETKEYEAVLKNSTIAKGKRSFEFTVSVPAVMGGLDITVSEGSAPAAEEDANGEE